MFRSRKFTIAFTVLVVLNIAAIAFLIYTVATDKFVEMTTGMLLAETETPSESGESVAESESAESGEAEAETSGSSALTGESSHLTPCSNAEPHEIPLIGELIPEIGVVRIPEGSEGVVFHKQPAFDAPNTYGNVINKSGGFDITGKFFMMDGATPRIMYQTFDLYYVTDDPAQITYQPQVPPLSYTDRITVGSFGQTNSAPLIMQIHDDDGSLFAFSLYARGDGETVPVLLNCTAKYESPATARFEYHDENGTKKKGTVTFKDRAQGAVYSANVMFETPVLVNGKSFTSIELQH